MDRLLTAAIVGLTAVGASLLTGIHPAAPHAWDGVWLLTLWLSVSVACVLVSSGRTRGMSVLCSLGVIVALTTLARGAALGTIAALMLVILVAAIATLLEVAMHSPEIIITETDSDRLTRLLDVLPDAQRSAASALEVELERAHVVASRAVPRDVVTMNSRVVFEEADTGRRSEAVLVYPHDTKHDANAVSVLAPVGSALLGMRKGQSIDWRMPSGRLKRYRVVDIVYQPEAAGDYHL